MPFLRPLPFSKVALVGLNDDRETLLTTLHDLGVVQVEPVGAEALEVVAPERASDLQRKVGDQLVRFRGLSSALPRTDSGRPFAFRTLAELLQAADSVSVDAEVGALKREEDQLLTERRSLSDTLDVLARFASYSGRYSDLAAKNAVALFGEGMDDSVARWKAQIPLVASTDLGTVPAERGTVRFLLAVPVSDVEAVTRLAGPLGVKLTAPPKISGTAAEERPRLTARLGEVDQRLAAIHARLGALASTWYPKVAALEEAFEIESRKLDVHTRLGATRRVFALEGWVPKRDMAKLRQGVATAVGDRAELFEVATAEEAPTYMENPVGVRRYEFFVRFYSLPKSSEWDPTWLFAIAFPIFFGLMLGDWGYGLVILGFCVWMISGFPGRRYVPKSLKNFLKMIMAPEGMQSLAYALVPGCLIAVALGLVFNDFFGAQVLPFQAPFDPIRDTGTLLLLAGYIGVTMVVIGFALGALKEYFHHRFAHALGKVGGILATFGVADYGLGVVRQTWGIFPDAASIVPFGVFVLGIVMLIGGSGLQEGGMTVLEVVSHTLSFMRLIGILLASVILASLINSIGGSLFASTGILAAVFILLGIVVILAGQIFNLVLGVFEPGIQGARLIFVEHFSKFYEGNGHEYRPFRSDRRHTAPASLMTTAAPPPPP
jgi:V/A-type H+-transporting ATPase subunit I